MPVEYLLIILRCLSFGNWDSVEGINSFLNGDLKCMKQWCDENTVCVNIDKSKYMLITIRQELRHQQTKQLEIKVDNYKQKNVNSHKIFGITIDNYLIGQFKIEIQLKRQLLVLTEQCRKILEGFLVE